MFDIDGKIVSQDIFDIYFACDYNKCKGICCVEGESGAPLKEEELLLIEESYPKIENLLSDKAKKEIEKNGLAVIDSDGDLVTPIIEGRECVYTISDDNGNYLCAFEKVYFEGKINFQKPISCALYPIRLTEYKDFTAVNYHKWSVCKCALKKGRNEAMPVFRFLKNPIIRAFGEDFYNQLEDLNEILGKEKQNK